MASLPGNFPRQSLWKVSKQTFALKKVICCSIILCTYCLFYYKHYVIRNAWLFKIKLEQWFLTSSLIWGNFIWKWSNQNDNFGLFCLLKKIPLALMGVLAPWSAHARPSARPPIDTSGNFSAHMSGGGGKCLTVFLINFLAKSENSKHFSFFSKKTLKILGGV